MYMYVCVSVYCVDEELFLLLLRLSLLSSKLDSRNEAAAHFFSSRAMLSRSIFSPSRKICWRRCASAGASECVCKQLVMHT